MKTILAILLLLPSVGYCQWRAVRISSSTDTQSIEENFRRASIYSNRKLDKYTPDTMYKKLTLKDDLVLEDGGVLTSTAPFAQLAATQTFTGADTFTGSVRISSLTIPSTTGLMISTFSATGNGFTYLPGGLLMQWGTGTAGATSGATSSHTFPKAFSSAVYSLSYVFYAAAIASNSNLVISSFSTTGFSTIRQNNGNADSFTTFYWLAIGY